MNVVEFLEARIAEDEAQLAATPSVAQDTQDFDYGGTDDYLRFTIGYGRAVAECAAKRAIIKSLVSTAAAHSAETRIDQKLVLAGMDTGLRLALTSLTAPYSDHPDYREEWSSAT